MDISRAGKEYGPKENQALKELRTSLSDLITNEMTDAVLLKFIKAKNFNIRKAERFFRGYLNILVSFQVEYLDDVWEKPEILQKYEFTGEIGFAKDDSPVRYIAMGRGDFIGFMNSIDAFDIGKYCLHYLEKDLRIGREHGKKLGKEINEVTYVIDMEEFSLRQIFSAGVVELGMDLFRIVQDYYPQVWKRVLIVNAPAYFSIAFNLFKPIFSRNLLQDMEVASKDGVANLLLKYIDVNVLPAFLGGNRVDSNGHGMCKEFISFGGKVPDKYYLKNSKPLLLATDPGVLDIWLGPKCSYNYSFVVREPNSVLHIECRTEPGSIQSGIFYRPFGPNPDKFDFPATDEYLDELKENFDYEMITPTAHCQTHDSPSNNHIRASRPGIYLIKFSNTHNWLSSRRILLRVRIMPPLLA